MTTKRFKDLPYGTFSYCFQLKNEGIWVTCEKCGGIAVLKLKEAPHSYILRCQSCFYSKQFDNSYNKKKTYQFTGICEACSTYIKYESEEKNHQLLTKKCPKCGTQTPLSRQKYYFEEEVMVAEGMDKVTGLPFYYVGSFKNNVFWAYNLKHLNYLIDYIESDLRIKPTTSDGISYKKTASHGIPAYMKCSKNRKQIVKVLKNLRENKK